MSPCCRFCLLLLLFAAPLRPAAQCYRQLFDVTGINTDPFQSTLNEAACELRDALPEEFRRDFGVFSCGFYVLQQDFKGFGYPDAFTRAQGAIDKPYYLIFGRQSDPTGIYTRFYVALKLPNTGKFSCIDRISADYRAAITTKQQLVANTVHDRNDRNVFQYYEAEIAAMDSLRAFVKATLECCEPGERLGPVCGGCLFGEEDFENIIKETVYKYPGIYDCTYTSLPVGPSLSPYIKGGGSGVEVSVASKSFSLDALITGKLADYQATGKTAVAYVIRTDQKCFELPRQLKAFADDPSYAKFLYVFIPLSDNTGRIYCISIIEKTAGNCTLPEAVTEALYSTRIIAREQVADNVTITYPAGVDDGIFDKQDKGIARLIKLGQVVSLGTGINIKIQKKDTILISPTLSLSGFFFFYNTTSDTVRRVAADGISWTLNGEKIAASSLFYGKCVYGVNRLELITSNKGKTYRSVIFLKKEEPEFYVLVYDSRKLASDTVKIKYTPAINDPLRSKSVESVMFEGLNFDDPASIIHTIQPLTDNNNQWIERTSTNIYYYTSNGRLQKSPPVFTYRWFLNSDPKPLSRENFFNLANEGENSIVVKVYLPHDTANAVTQRRIILKKGAQNDEYFYMVTINGQRRNKQYLRNGLVGFIDKCERPLHLNDRVKIELFRKDKKNSSVVKVTGCDWVLGTVQQRNSDDFNLTISQNYSQITNEKLKITKNNGIDHTLTIYFDVTTTASSGITSFNTPTIKVVDTASVNQWFRTANQLILKADPAMYALFVNPPILCPVEISVVDSLNPNLAARDVNGNTSDAWRPRDPYQFLDVKYIQKDANKIVRDFELVRLLSNEERTCFLQPLRDNEITKGALARDFNTNFVNNLKRIIADSSPVLSAADRTLLDTVYALVRAGEWPEYLEFTKSAKIFLNYDVIKKQLMPELQFAKTLAHEMAHNDFSRTQPFQNLRWTIMAQKNRLYRHNLGDALGKNGHCSAGIGHEMHNPENAQVCNKAKNIK